MDINHNPEFEAVEPTDDEMTLFESLSVGESYQYFGLPVTPPTVVEVIDDETFGRVVVSETEGEQEVLYMVDGCLWMNTPDPELADTHENIPFPIESLQRVD